MADVQLAEQALVQAGAKDLALHVLIESPAAVHRAFDIAAQPRVQSLSFGLMDFVSAHGGAIPAHGMGVQGQFTHPLVVRAKLEIASACHAHGKVPSHCVVTEFNDTAAMRAAAQSAAHEFGYTRMWSIHPAQIRPILEAMAPDAAAIEVASEIVLAARAAQWALSVTKVSCMTARVTASFGKCWNVRTARAVAFQMKSSYSSRINRRYSCKS